MYTSLTLTYTLNPLLNIYRTILFILPGEVLSMAADLSAADLSAADSAIEAASTGAVPRALRVEELLYEADKNISRSGSFSSLSGDTSGMLN